VWQTGLPSQADAASLCNALRERGLAVLEGGHAIYVPPQSGLDALAPEARAFYGEGVGFKILRDLRGPHEARYLRADATSSGLRNMLIGKPVDQITPANYLAWADLGPRVVDLCEWVCGDTRLTVFAVEHVEGRPPHEDEIHLFRERLASLIGNGFEVATPGWKCHKDFTPPDCNGNLIVTRDRALRYVDFQNFYYPDRQAWPGRIAEKATGTLHFGGARLFRERLLYQSIPGVSSSGKRQMQTRWTLFTERLDRLGIRCQGRLVLDVGCNSGMIVHAALSEGALFGLGWDRPPIAEIASELLTSLGATRFSITGASLSSEYPLTADISARLKPHLPNAVIFYLAMHQHVGVIEAVVKMPWKALVHEGHQGETMEEFLKVSEGFTRSGARIADQFWVADGDSQPRPGAILLRA
jgi:hypothetical protein